jgi:hypothetical protein
LVAVVATMTSKLQVVPVVTTVVVVVEEDTPLETMVDGCKDTVVQLVVSGEVLTNRMDNLNTNNSKAMVFPKDIKTHPTLRMIPTNRNHNIPVHKVLSGSNKEVMKSAAW